MPEGSGGALDLSYSSPIADDSPTDTVDSTFPDILGTSADNSTLIGDPYASLDAAELAITAVSNAADEV